MMTSYASVVRLESVGRRHCDRGLREGLWGRRRSEMEYIGMEKGRKYGRVVLL